MFRREVTKVRKEKASMCRVIKAVNEEGGGEERGRCEQRTETIF